MTERLPRADAVLQPGRDVVCRPCDQEIVGQEAFVGVTEADPAHVCWECPDCGRRVVELVEEVQRYE
jgi:RNase P subunit RPR2